LEFSLVGVLGRWSKSFPLLSLRLSVVDRWFARLVLDKSVIIGSQPLIG